MTPNDLEILIHYYGTPFEHERIAAGAVSETVAQYLADGIFERAEPRERWTASYQLTDKGRAWLEMILSTPQPEMRWVDPRDK